MTPHLCICCSLLFLMISLSFWSLTLEGLFELILCPPRALNPASFIASGNKNEVRCASLGAEVPVHCETTDNLDCALV